MGCYGIGISRIIAAAIEQSHDEKGIIFPAAIAPFEVIITPRGYDKHEGVRKQSDLIYQELLALEFDVLLDDRGLRPGVMFSEAELIGIPHRITISEKSIANKKVEYKNRKSEESILVDLDNLNTYLSTL
jgi:prolyl-tRNA synthetase